MGLLRSAGCSWSVAAAAVSDEVCTCPLADHMVVSPCVFGVLRPIVSCTTHAGADYLAMWDHYVAATLVIMLQQSHWLVQLTSVSFHVPAGVVLHILVHDTADACNLLGGTQLRSNQTGWHRIITASEYMVQCTAAVDSDSAQVFASYGVSP